MYYVFTELLIENHANKYGILRTRLQNQSSIVHDNYLEMGMYWLTYCIS